MLQAGYLKQVVLPCDFDVSRRFSGTSLRKSEKETIARNIIIICQRENQGWLQFTWNRYVELCGHNPTLGEKGVMDGFVKDGLLTCTDGVYAITDAFIHTLNKYIKRSGE